MKASEITSKEVIILSRIDEDAPDLYLIDSMFLPAAKAHIRGIVGMTDEELDQYEDIPIAICALCAHFYDNRSVEIASEKVNQVVADIIGKYDKNLIPRGDSA